MLGVAVESRKQLGINEFLNNAKFNLATWIAIALSGQLSNSQLGALAVQGGNCEYGAFFEGADTGTATAHAVQIASNLTAYVTGLMVFYKVNVTNTGAVTVNLTPNSNNPIGATALVKNLNQPLAPGDLQSGEYVLARYDGTNFQLLSTTGNPLDRYGTTAGTGNAYTLTFGGTTGYPVVSAYFTGLRLLVKFDHANTGAATLAVDGLAAVPVLKNNALAYGNGEILASTWIELVYDATANSGSTPGWVATGATVNNIPPAVVGLASNLIIQPDNATPTVKVGLTADQLIVKTAGGVGALLTSVNASANITVNGAGGLDTGTATTSTWYYVWMIYDGTNQALLLSLSATAPTLPTGYTYQALMGAVYNNSGNAFDPFYQMGRTVATTVKTGADAAFAGTLVGSSYQSLSLAGFVPPTAKAVKLTAGRTSSSSIDVVFALDATGLGEQAVVALNGGGTPNGWDSAGTIEILLKTPQTTYWHSGAGGSLYQVRVCGFTL